MEESAKLKNKIGKQVQGGNNKEATQERNKEVEREQVKRTSSRNSKNKEVAMNQSVEASLSNNKGEQQGMDIAT